MNIYTYGHGAQKFEEFNEKIKEAGIDLLVDIREKPFSRYFPHFNRSNLEKEFGLRYLFAGDFLGGSSVFHNDLLEYIKNRGENVDDSNNKLFTLISEDLKLKIFSSNKEFSNKRKREIWITENFLRYYISSDKKDKAITFLKNNIFIKNNLNKNICFFCSEKDHRICHRYLLLEKEWLKEIEGVCNVIHLGSSQEKIIDSDIALKQDNLFK